jgi:hypothetical protein
MVNVPYRRPVADRQDFTGGFAMNLSRVALHRNLRYHDVRDRAGTGVLWRARH